MQTTTETVAAFQHDLEAIPWHLLRFLVAPAGNKQIVSDRKLKNNNNGCQVILNIFK